MARRRRTIHDQTAGRRGFTLIESLMAAGILLVIVTAVGLAVSSGQQHGHWAQMRIAGTLAADELMCRIQATAYDRLDEWRDHLEAAGEMVDVNGNPLPTSFAGIGRSVTVTETMRLSPVGTVEIVGRVVRVHAFDSNDLPLAELRRFVPQPMLPAAEVEENFEF